MSAILDPPRTVYCLAGAETVSALREALEADDCSVEGVDEGRLEAVVRPGEDAGCVVVTDEESDVVTATERVRTANDAVPVLVMADDGSEALASEVSLAGATTYLPRIDVEHAAGLVATAVSDLEEQLIQREESQMFGALIDTLQVPLYAKDAEARHLRMTHVPGGLDEASALGKTDPEIYTWDEEAAQAFYEDDMHVIERGEPIIDRIEQSGPPGNEFWARTSKIPWRDEEGIVRGLVGLTVDVTERHQLESEVAHLREEFDTFASFIAHDLKNPLQVTSGSLEIARETGDAEAFDRIQRAHERMAQMIDDLGAVAREHAPESNDLEAIDFVPLVWDVWEHLDTGEASLVLEESESARVWAEEVSLRPVLENLMRNAVVHGGDAVTVTVELISGGFVVADDGPGIPIEERRRIFEEGFTTNDAGSGTGLSIVSDIVERNNWTVDVGESTDGGARFAVTNLPVVPRPTLTGTPGATVDLEHAAAVGDVDVEGDVDVGGGVGDGDGDGVDDAAAVTLRGGIQAEQGDRDFYGYSTTVDGPVRLTARVASVEHVNDYSMGGVMVRGDGSRDAPFAFVGPTVGRGTDVVWREGHGEDEQGHPREWGEHEWVRIERIDDTVTVSRSTDGTDWEPLDQRTLPLDESAWVGLAVSSAVPGEPCEARFEAVECRRLDVD